MQNFLNTLWEFTRGKEDKDNFIQKALKVCKVFRVKPLKISKPDVPSKKTAYNLFCKDIQKIKKELQGVPVSKASAIISKESKKVKASNMKKYRDLYKEEKQRHEEALQRYQDHIDEMEIINLHKRCKKTDTKVAAKTGVKTTSKAPRSRYHLFMRKQPDKMTEENQKIYCNIVLRRRKEIKEDPSRLFA